jgi:OOP family OmpA-OmpF porin
LLKAYGLPQNLLIAQGMGATQPIASNDTPDGRERNRRVVFRVTQRASITTQ